MSIIQDPTYGILQIPTYATGNHAPFLNLYPPLTTKRKGKASGKISCLVGKMTKLKIMYERGWEGHVRMLLKPIRFCDLGHVSNSVKSIRAQLIDICSYLGYQGDEGPASQQRVCRIYFDPQLYPAPHELNEGGNTETFNELTSYIAVLLQTMNLQ